MPSGGPISFQCPYVTGPPMGYVQSHSSMKEVWTRTMFSVQTPLICAQNPPTRPSPPLIGPLNFQRSWSGATWVTERTSIVGGSAKLEDVPKVAGETTVRSDDLHTPVDELAR